ncbi:MAG: BolA/IbaG family iron-sulfur metabolism protein [Hydrotalea sp.]|nr:BolA/IbaG family iron-sulfur metabolism protein [Hydrotalea sp.]
MPVSREDILADLKKSFPNAQVVLTPLVDDDDHWKLEIAATEFAGLSRVQQHQLVYRALNQKLARDLHALQLITKLL